MIRSIATVVTTALITFAGLPNAFGEDQQSTFKVGGSVYVGWMWLYDAAADGTLAHFAKEEGIEIEFVAFKDYMKSVSTFGITNGLDACVMTNMDALSTPAAGGIDTTILYIGDYSNGNDILIVKPDVTPADLIAGKVDVYLAKLSVSHYLFYRWVQEQGETDRNTSLKDLADAALRDGFTQDANVKAAAPWNPHALQCRQVAGSKVLFDSSNIPGEILDCMVIKTGHLQTENGRKFARALGKTWFAKVGQLNARGSARKAAIESQASLSGDSPAEFEAQLRTTFFYNTPKAAADYASSSEVMTRMQRVRDFCFAAGLYPPTAKSADIVGIQFPDGTVIGDSKNVKLRFETTVLTELGK